MPIKSGLMSNKSGHLYPARRRKAHFAVLAGATLVLAGCGGLDRNGQFREDPLENFEQKVIGGALASAGLIPPQREKIIYTPRAPLALPPPQATGRLRPPEDSTEIAAANANWPLDPDEARKQRLIRQRNEQRKEQFDDNQIKRLSIEQIEADRGTVTATTDPNAPNAPRELRFEGGGVVLPREELERGWTKPSENSGWSLFEVDETVDVRDRVRAERAGEAKDYIDQNNGSNNSFQGTLDRVDTSRLDASKVAKRNSVIDPPSSLRIPAPDSTVEAPAAAAPRTRPEDRAWWQWLING